MTAKLPRWAHWVGLLVGVSTLGGTGYAFLGRFLVTREAYAQDVEAHGTVHRAEAEAMRLALVQALKEGLAVLDEQQRAKDAARDLKLDIIVCEVRGGSWDALRVLCGPRARGR